jgi:cell division protein FtsL
MDFDDKILTTVIVVNTVINFMILYLVAPMYQIKGTLKQALITLGHHEKRLLSLEERSNGR